MFNHEFFVSRTWRAGLVNFAKARKVPAPVVEVHCMDGTSFKLAGCAPGRPMPSWRPTARTARPE